MGRLRFLLYGCGLRFFSWTRKILSFLGDWRVSGGRVYFPLCGSLPRGAAFGWPFISLEVFDWHGGRCCCAVFVGLHNLCLSSWVCHVGLLFWLSIHFGGVIWLARWAVLVLWCHALGSNHVDLLLQSSFVVLCHVGLLFWLTIHIVGHIWLALVECVWRWFYFSWCLVDSFLFYRVIAPRSKHEYLFG